jgi:glycerophosphoryl diester phosphodiesterase
MRTVWVVAHRGASAHAPENTLAAFRRAVELGAAFIETDLHLTRDAKIVAIHDATLERTTNGEGRVKDWTLADLRELDAGSWFAPEFSGERIPTLEEILAFAREADVVFFLEIKAAVYGVEHAVVGALRAAQEAARTVILSFDAASLQVVRKLEPALMTGLLFDDGALAGPAILDRALHVGARQIAPRGDLVTPEFVAAARERELLVVPWTVNEPGWMRQLVAAGVNGIMTDYPDRLRAILK